MPISYITRVTWLLLSWRKNNAQLFAQFRTLRIRRLNSLNFSTVWPTSPFLALPLCDGNYFHGVSRAAAQMDS